MSKTKQAIRRILTKRGKIVKENKEMLKVLKDIVDIKKEYKVEDKDLQNLAYEVYFEKNPESIEKIPDLLKRYPSLKNYESFMSAYEKERNAVLARQEEILKNQEALLNPIKNYPNQKITEKNLQNENNPNQHQKLQNPENPKTLKQEQIEKNLNLPELEKTIKQQKQPNTLSSDDVQKQLNAMGDKAHKERQEQIKEQTNTTLVKKLGEELNKDFEKRTNPKINLQEKPTQKIAENQQNRKIDFDAYNKAHSKPSLPSIKPFEKRLEDIKKLPDPLKQQQELQKKELQQPNEALKNIPKAIIPKVQQEQFTIKKTGVLNNSNLNSDDIKKLQQKPRTLDFNEYTKKIHQLNEKIRQINKPVNQVVDNMKKTLEQKHQPQNLPKQKTYEEEQKNLKDAREMLKASYRNRNEILWGASKLSEADNAKINNMWLPQIQEAQKNYKDKEEPALVWYDMKKGDKPLPSPLDKSSKFTKEIDDLKRKYPDPSPEASKEKIEGFEGLKNELNKGQEELKISKVNSQNKEQEKPKDLSNDRSEISRLMQARNKVIHGKSDLSEKQKSFINNMKDEILKDARENLEQLKPQIKFFNKLDEYKKLKKPYDDKVFDEFKAIKQEVPEHLNICDKAIERFPKFNKQYNLHKNGKEQNQELKNAYNPQPQQPNQTQINSGNNVQVIIIGNTPPNLEFIANYLKDYAEKTNDPNLRNTLGIASHNVQEAANIMKENKNNITGQNCSKIIDTVNKIVTTQVVENLNQTKQTQPIVDYTKNLNKLNKSQTQEEMNANKVDLQNSKTKVVAQGMQSMFINNNNQQYQQSNYIPNANNVNQQQQNSFKR